MGYGLAATAAVFVFVCGANDGGALVALAIRHGCLPGYGLIAVLLATLLAGPALFGLAVAHTFTDRLVDPDTAQAHALMLTGVGVALLVVLVLTWGGIPTSVTLAVVGGLTGAGAGLGLVPSWTTLCAVLAVAAATPVVGGGLAFLLGRLAGRLPTWSRLPALVRVGHLAAFTGLALAYAANDGQKIFAVISVANAALHRTAGGGTSALPVLFAAAALFAAGTLVSLRRMIRRTTFQLVALRPWHLVSAQVAASAAVFATAAGGMPVSITQSATAGMVGAGASHGVRRVRWQHTFPVATSWLATLPVSLLLGAVGGLLVRSAG